MIWASSNTENDIRKFGVKFEVELYRQHEKNIVYHLKAYNFRIAIMKNNFSSLGSHDPKFDRNFTKIPTISRK